MKKIVVYLCFVMLLGLSACGNRDKEPGKNDAVRTDGSETAEGKDTEVAESGLPAETEGGTKLDELKVVIVDTIGSGNYYPDMSIEPDQLEEIFGITSDMYDDYLAEVCADGTNVDTLLIIKAKDDKVETVQEAMFAYREAKEEATLEDSRNIGKVKASRIETNGNFVSFVQLGGDITAALEVGESAVIEQCLQMNELVLEVIAQNVH